MARNLFFGVLEKWQDYSMILNIEVLLYNRRDLEMV